MSFSVKFIGDDEDIPKDLAEDDREEISDMINNGDGGVVLLMQMSGACWFVSDNMEPEDASFHRDLNWVKLFLERAYEHGVNEGIRQGKKALDVLEDK